MYPKQQTDLYLSQAGATFVRTANGVEWWRLKDNSWLARREVGGGMFELRRFPAGSCGC